MNDFFLVGLQCGPLLLQDMREAMGKRGKWRAKHPGHTWHTQKWCGERRWLATPKRWGFVRNPDKPIHGSCTIYFPGGISIYFWSVQCFFQIIAFSVCSQMDHNFGREPLKPSLDSLSQLRLVVYPIIYMVLDIPGSCLGFQPSTVSLENKMQLPTDIDPSYRQYLKRWGQTSRICWGPISWGKFDPSPSSRYLC